MAHCYGIKSDKKTKAPTKLLSDIMSKNYENVKREAKNKKGAAGGRDCHKTSIWQTIERSISHSY